MVPVSRPLAHFAQDHSFQAPPWRPKGSGPLLFAAARCFNGTDHACAAGSPRGGVPGALSQLAPGPWHGAEVLELLRAGLRSLTVRLQALPAGLGPVSCGRYQDVFGNTKVTSKELK